MQKDYFQRNIELMNELRSEHFKYREYLQKGKYKLKQKFFGKGKKHYDFDINSQEYFHQEINDITFQSSQTQQYFFEMVNNAINQPLKVNNKQKFPQQTSNSQSSFHSQLKAFPEESQNLLVSPMSISNPSQCRVLLSKHFYQRIYNLKYKKYLLQQRYHNLRSQDKHETILPFIQSRIQLIDKEIISAINRSTRLQHNDYFQESYVHNGKPVPISQTGQPIYKYLDEEQCWYSSIQRDDILVYTRNSQFNRDILGEQYYPLESQIKAIVIKDGVDVYLQVQSLVQKSVNQVNQKVAKMAEQFNSLIEKQLELISPGNLVEKQNLTNFGYTIFGMLSNTPLTLPLYPAIYPEFFITLTESTQLFFNNIKFTTQQQIIQLLPKLNSFCQILFKYQNKEILQGKKQIKLGLQDDIDLKKQLHTMLEELWVQKYVNLPFQRYDYKIEIKKVDWPLDSISYEKNRQSQRKSNYQLKMDTSAAELINLMTLNDFLTFRKHMKHRAQKILSRCQTKYLDMQQIIKYNQKSSEQMTLDELSDLFRIKNSQQKEQFLKPTGEMFLNMIMKKHWLVNPAQIQIQETLKFLSIRQDRTKIMNILNGLRCYHRNLCMDLRVLTGQDFKFRLDDEFLINSNKQVIQNFQKAIKQTQTFMTTRVQNENNGGVSEQFYLQKQNYSKEMLFKKDVVKVKNFRKGQQKYNKNQEQTQVPHVLVHNGNRMKSNILYGVVLQTDLPQVQKRILSNATKIVNQYQRYIKITSREQIVDRVELLRIIYSLQLKFLYEKFKLVEQYYYIYENTTNFLDAFKLSQTITKLIYQQPQIDLTALNHGLTFAQIYQNHIESFKLELSFLDKFVEKLKNQEQNHVENFHKKYSELMKIPLTSQLYLYRDLQSKQKTKNKLQRLNSISSKLSSKSSKAANLKNNLPQNQQIREEFDQESVGSESSFDIQNYDEYLLKKDMDAIFDDMIQVDDNKDTTPINTAVQQNIVVNPRFQGGPHPYNYACEQLEITTQKKQNLMNFFETLSFAGNIRFLIQKLKQQFSSIYGYVSSTYQTFLSRVIRKFMNDIMLSPLKKIQKWKMFESFDPYHEIVTQSSKHYLQLMAPAIDPPSNIQMAIASTLEKHQEKLHPFNILNSLDYYSIQSLICLKKPINIASYRQLALGINYLTFLNIRQSLYMIQLRREKIIQAYQKLAVNCGAATDRYSSMYTRSGQSNIFLSVQQLRQFKQQSYEFPVLPEVLSELRTLLQCEISDLQLFQTIIKSTKIKLEDLIIMKSEVNKNFLNPRFDNSRLLAKDSKTVKMIKNRISGEISSIYSEEMKKNSFVKIKQQLKIKVERLIKQVQESDFSSHLTFPKQKISEYCKELLTQKYKRKLVFQIIDCYWKDLRETNVKNKVFLQTDRVIKRIRKLVECSPYMRKVFNLSGGGERVDKKILYDQKKTITARSQILRSTVSQGVFFHPHYVYSRQQLCDQWSEQDSLARINNLSEFQIHKIDFHPPTDKQKLFKWLYKIPHFSLSDYQQKAMDHFIQELCLPFTGKCSMSEYMESPASVQPPRNRFYTIYEHYSTLLEYLQMNYLLILLQAEDDTFQSLEFLLKNDNINFEEIFKLKDEISVNQSLASMEKSYLKTCFNYKQNRQSDKNALKQKLGAQSKSKSKDRWVVYDQIIDFIVSKIQGRGLIRQNLLPFVKQLQNTLSAKDGTVIDIMKKKTQQISHIFILSTLQAYLNEQHQKIQESQSFSHYVFPILKWFLNNQHEFYQNVSSSANPRFGLNQKITTDHQEIQKFILGIFNDKNSRMIKTSSIIEKYKAVIMINTVNLNEFIRNFLKSKLENSSLKNNSQVGKSLLQRNSSTRDSQTSQSSLYLYDMNFFPSGMQLFSQMGQQNRLKIFSRMRYFYQKVSDHMKIKPNITKVQQIEETKLNYVRFMFSSKIQSLATVVFTSKPSFPVSSKAFKQVSTTLKQQVEKATFTIFDKFQEYKLENKIQFGKSEQKLMAIVDDVKKNQKLAAIYNQLIREVINAKLTRQEFKSRAFMQSIKLLKNEKIQHIEPKKIINTSLIPRVHLIASYSSPLILERKTYISQQYKLAFAQAFINRFRNKVSRVDLLSSGYGFVITVPDLQDCVNFMNKLLFTFAQKEFRYRQETSQQYFEILIQAVNEKNKIITEQEEIIKYLKSKVQNIMEAQYLGKVTGLLHEKTVIQDKLREVQQSTKGLQDRVRKTVQIQYEKKITSLQAENQILKNKFNQFKELFVTLTKDSAKNNFLNVANSIRQKIGDLLSKRIDVKQAFVTGEAQENSKRSSRIVKEQINSESKLLKEQQGQVSIQPYTTSDLQRCALGQDIIHDPYYTTKLIQKMRLFNIFKLGCKKIHFEQAQEKKTSELKQLHKIQDTVIVQSERQILVRQELKRTQEQLSKKTSQLQKVKQSYEMLDNERTKLKILLAGKDKKIEQKEREALQNIKRLQQIQKLPNLSQSQSKIEKNEEEKPATKLSQYRKLHNKKSTKIQKSPFVTSLPYQHSVSIYDRFQLSNKDATWRQKCEQLYIENKKLLGELEKAHCALTTPTREGYSLNLRQRKNSESFSHGNDQSIGKKEDSQQSRKQKRFPNLGFKYNLMKQTMNGFGQ